MSAEKATTYAAFHLVTSIANLAATASGNFVMTSRASQLMELNLAGYLSPDKAKKVRLACVERLDDNLGMPINHIRSSSTIVLQTVGVFLD